MKIISKRYLGKKKVYDLRNVSPNSNFIANNIVVHNCNFLEVVQGSDRVQSTSETYDAAESMHDAMFNRMNSRFINPRSGLLDGMLVMISSSRYPNDFLEKKAREHFKLGPNSHIFVRRRTLWECKPKWYFSGIKFHFDLKTKKVMETPDEIESLKTDAAEIKEKQAKERLKNEPSNAVVS